MQTHLSLSHKSMITMLSLGVSSTSSVHHLNIVQQTTYSLPLRHSSLSLKPLGVPRTGFTSPSDAIRLCKEGRLEESFEAFGSLLRNDDGFSHLSSDLISCMLELCASRGAVFEGKQIHGRIVPLHGNNMDAFLGTKLLFMYAKCGSLHDARKVFDGMSERTVFTWNGLIGGLVNHGQSVEALRLCGRMCEDGVPFDACTFACALKACGELKDIDFGRGIHGQAIKSGLGLSIFVCNALVSMYARCNELDCASRVFDGLSEERDAVSWNSIISAHSQIGNSVEALRLFRVMQSDGVPMNSFITVSILQACADPTFVLLGMEIHARLVKSCLDLNLYESNALLVMYARSSRMDYASLVFRKMNERDGISWNSMLSGYVQNSMYNKALDFFNEMQQKGWETDNVSIIIILSACGRLGSLFHGMEAHAYAIKFGFDSDTPVANTILDMYTKCSRIDYAELVFFGIPEKDIISWTTMMAAYAQNFHFVETIKLFREVQMLGMVVDPMMFGSILIACSGLGGAFYVKQLHGYITRHGLSDPVLVNGIVDAYGQMGNLEYAFHVFNNVREKDVVSWTTMISSYVHNGLPNDALDLFNEMQEHGHQPDAVTLVTVLSATAALSAMNRGKEVHAYLIRKCFCIDGSIGNALVEMYSKCGSVDTAYRIFDGIYVKDLVLWSSMISAFGMHGQGSAAMDLFSRMQRTSVEPDHIAFLAILHACSHSGLVEEGKAYLESMRWDYNLEPWPEHYACMVDLLGRNNHLNEAYDFIQNMTVRPTAAVWCALLGACRVYSNTEIGSLAAQKLLELEPGNPGNYVLVSNFYALAGKWKDVENAREKMRQRGLKKNPACSWIEVGNKMHSFIVGDKSHPQTEDIYATLAEIKIKLEKAGFVSKTELVLHDVGEEEKVKMLYRHSERLAISFGLISTKPPMPIRITKNLRICADCHEFTKLVSKIHEREIIIRDANRFHHCKDGLCSCGDFW